MADKKISQLPQGVINSNSIFPMLSNGITSKVSYSDMSNAFGGGGSQTFDQVLGNGNTTDREYYNEYIHESGVKMLAGTFTGNTENPFPVNGVRLDLADQVPGAFIQLGFGIGEGPFIQLDYKQGEEEETIRKYFYFDFQTETESNGQRILTDKDLPPIFRGIFNQEGTNNPTITTFSNSTNQQYFIFNRESEGVYYTNVTGNYIAYINVGQNYVDSNSKVYAYTIYNDKLGSTEFWVYTESDGVLSDNVAYNMLIEIGLKEYGIQ